MSARGVKQPRVYSIAFWNLENLFDTEDARRPQWLQQHLAAELQGWNDEVLEEKLERLARGINAMNHGQGPDILGVCEVENARVLRKLIAKLRGGRRRFGVAHADTQDQRGIDVAFIYDKRAFSAHEQFSHVVLKRNATRDLFQVTFEALDSGKKLVLIGNHWPSRLGGVEISAPYRALAAETLAYWMTRIPEHLGADIPIIALGDFNDEPFDVSVTRYLRANRDSGQVLRARTERLLNLAWPQLAQQQCTHYYGGPLLLDQIIVNKSLLTGAGGFALAQPELGMRVERVGAASVTTGAPIRFGRPSSAGGVNDVGVSDHFAVCVEMVES